MSLRHPGIRLQVIGGIIAYFVLNIAVSAAIGMLAKDNPILLPLTGRLADTVLSLLLTIPFLWFFLRKMEKDGILSRENPCLRRWPAGGATEAPAGGIPAGIRRYSLPDLLATGTILGVLALLIGCSLYIILLLPPEYDSRLPFTGMYGDRIIVVIAIAALAGIFLLARRWDRQGITRWRSFEEATTRRREWDRLYHFLRGRTGGTRQELVAKINRNMLYLLVFNSILFSALAAGRDPIWAEVLKNAGFLSLLLLVPPVSVILSDYWYSDDIRALEGEFCDPSARLWLRVTPWAGDSPLFTAWIGVLVVLMVSLLICAAVSQFSVSAILFLLLLPAAACIVSLLGRVK